MQVPVHGSCLDSSDWAALQQAVDAKWLTAGLYAKQFERALCKRFDRRFAVFCNSGSSALWMAMSALELPKGSEVITCANAFPTTINPIIQCGLIPVFVDCEPGTWNVDTTQLEAALSDQTQAVVVAHTLGNPVDLNRIYNFCYRHGLRLIEDCCDAAGATYMDKQVGAEADFSTYSFHPAHHITAGGGGAVLTDDARLAKIAKSFMQHGRDCWCDPGTDNTCGKRFAGEYDHRYTYSHIGMNLMALDPQAAMLISQLDKLDKFVAARRHNWRYLRDGLDDLSQYAQICFPSATSNSEPSWFGFAFGTEDRNELAKYLDSRGVGNRPLFAGNIIRQPAYKDVEVRVVGDLHVADYVMDSVLFIGCWPGLSVEQLDYAIEVIYEFFAA